MNLVVAITGATGAHAAELLIDKSPWPVSLVVSHWGWEVCERENVSLDELSERVDTVFEDSDLFASISSGSVPTAGMVILPCSTNTLGKISAGIADSLITRSAHCHLKERRPLILCVRETPWTLIDIKNAGKVAAAGGTIMPFSPPYYMSTEKNPDEITMTDLFEAYVDRILSVLNHPPEKNWETIS